MKGLTDIEEMCLSFDLPLITPPTTQKISPKKAIKLRCRDCQPEAKDESLCIGCQLKDNSLSNLKKIKTYCKEFCCNHSKKEALLCADKLCSLYPYRLGKNPNRAGIGGKHIKKLVKIVS